MMVDLMDIAHSACDTAKDHRNEPAGPLGHQLQEASPLAWGVAADDDDSGVACRREEPAPKVIVR
jgi:hypothetical protein